MCVCALVRDPPASLLSRKMHTLSIASVIQTCGVYVHSYTTCTTPSACAVCALVHYTYYALSVSTMAWNSSAAGELVRAAARRGPVSLQPLFQVGAREEFLEVVVLWA